MRAHVLAIFAVAAIFALPVSTSAGVRVGPGGVEIGGGRHGNCDELRRACLNKDRLGEEGEGNCRRYRRLCRR